MFNPVFDSPFYPDMFGPSTQADLRKHKVWPLIIALKMECNLYLQALMKPLDGSTKYLLCDGTGLRQAVLVVDKDEEITFSVTKNSFHTVSSDTEELLKSKNVKYMLGRLNKLKEDPHSALHTIQTRGADHFMRYMREMVTGLLLYWNDTDGRTRYAPQMDVGLRIKAMKMLNGTLTKSDFSTSELTSVAFELQRITERDEKHKEYRQNVLNYLSGPKFVFMYDATPASSLLFGAIELTNPEEMLDNIYEADGSWYTGPEATFQINHDFRRLKVLSSDNGSVLPALPVEFKDVVMSTLHLDKMNRSSRRVFTQNDPLFPVATLGHVLFNDSPSFCWKGGSSMSNFFLISDKRSLLI
jgi:hypothetical protein